MRETTERPLVSFAVIAYNQERFIREAIEGAFAQTYEPLEIILSDDCSPDRTYAIMQEMAAAYDGPHRVVLNRNEPNLGIAGHFNKIMEKAEGAFVVVNAGDDVSLPDRTLITVNALLQDKTLAYAETQILRISDDSVPLDEASVASKTQRYCLDDLINRRIRFSGAVRTYRKSAINGFPPLDPRCPTEDTTSLLRCLLHGDGVVLADTSLKWRTHSSNMSSSNSLKRMPLLYIYSQYKADVHYMKKTGALLRPRARQVLGSLAYWIIRRLAAQQDMDLQSASKKLRVIMTSGWLSFMERIFVVESIIRRERNIK